MKFLTYDETKKFRPPTSIDNLTLWTREERHIINKFRMKLLDNMEKKIEEKEDVV
jgi:hypothetical protein